jgi:predicted house-cleaning NTP pyrophosphatase (Maf/HAM1 superfamily)
MKDIILASQSPRRQDLMSQLGLAFTCADPEADEILPKDIKPQQGVQLVDKSSGTATG